MNIYSNIQLVDAVNGLSTNYSTLKCASQIYVQWICRFDQILISQFCATARSPPIIFDLLEKHHE